MIGIPNLHYYYFLISILKCHCFLLQFDYFLVNYFKKMENFRIQQGLLNFAFLKLIHF